MSVTMTGGLSKLTESEITDNMYMILADVGEFGIEAMKNHTEPHDFRESLTQSIMWRTRKEKGGNEGNDSEIDIPEPFAVSIGSANDHAFFREYGTGQHVTNYKQDEFLRNIAEWCEMKLGFSPQDNPNRYWAIVKKIRQNGTAAAPFALSSVDEITATAKRLSRYHLKEFWRTRRV